MQSKNPFHRVLAKPPVPTPNQPVDVAEVLEIQPVLGTKLEDVIITPVVRADKSVICKSNESASLDKENCSSVLSPAVAKACKVRENRNHVENRLRLDLDMVMREKTAAQKEVHALTTELEVR